VIALSVERSWLAIASAESSAGPLAESSSAVVIAAAARLNSCRRLRATVGWPRLARHSRKATTVASAVQWNRKAAM
jgi:hypothetical protein